MKIILIFVQKENDRNKLYHFIEAGTLSNKRYKFIVNNLYFSCLRRQSNNKNIIFVTIQEKG